MRRLYYLLKFYLLDRRRCMHEFDADNWTDMNNDPRCIHCGKYFLDKIVHDQPGRYFECRLRADDETFVWVPKLFW